MSIRVTEHAVARYCERVLGLDRAVLEQSMTDLVGDAHDGRFKLPGLDVIAVVENRTVLSFVPSGECPVAKAKIKTTKKSRKQRPWLTEVERYEWIEVRFLNIMGRQRIDTIRGAPARLFQHEFDHLEGRCIFPRP